MKPTPKFSGPQGSDFPIAILILLLPAIWLAIPNEAPAPSVSNRLTTIVLENSALDYSASEPSQIASLAIRDVRVGMRVPAHNPEIDNEERMNWSDVDYSSWRKFTVSVTKEGGGEVTVVLLRPASWLVESVQSASLMQGFEKFKHPSVRKTEVSLVEANCGGGVNSLVWMELRELGAVGFGTVLKNETPPLIQKGQGEVVTGTFLHQSANILDLTFQPTSESSRQNQFTALESDSAEIDTGLEIGTTSVHPFWSIDREEFVPAGKLKLDEKVVTIEGQVWRLTSIVPRAGPEPVYNFEVANEHVYYVGKQGVLVHNSYPEKKYVEFVHGTSLTSAKSIKAKGLNVKEAKRLSKGGRANNNGLDTSIVTPKTWKMRGEEASGWAARHAGKGEQGLLIGD